MSTPAVPLEVEMIIQPPIKPPRRFPMSAMTSPVLPATPDYAAIKARQNATWASGDYARIGTTLQFVGESLAEAMDLPPDARVLDVAAGNGNATLAFARRGARVTSTDYVGTLLDRGRARADAEALPFPDASFDAVASTFGVMFTPDQSQAAAEMVRVCRPGGRIGLANWTPDGFIGHLFKTIGRHVPPPAGVKSPALWGDKAWLQETFGRSARGLALAERAFVFRYRSPAHFLDVFRTYYGPMHKAFLALDPTSQQALERDLLDTVALFDTARDGTMRVPSTYAEVILTKG